MIQETTIMEIMLKQKMGTLLIMITAMKTVMGLVVKLTMAVASVKESMVINFCQS